MALFLVPLCTHRHPLRWHIRHTRLHHHPTFGSIILIVIPLDSVFLQRNAFIDWTSYPEEIYRVRICYERRRRASRPGRLSANDWKENWITDWLSDYRVTISFDSIRYQAVSRASAFCTVLIILPALVDGWLPLIEMCPYLDRCRHSAPLSSQQQRVFEVWSGLPDSQIKSPAACAVINLCNLKRGSTRTALRVLLKKTSSRYHISCQQYSKPTPKWLVQQRNYGKILPQISPQHNRISPSYSVLRENSRAILFTVQ